MTLRRFKTLLLPLCAACLLLAGWMVYHAIAGGQLAGCGAGSGCDAVMGSRWAWVLRGVPVALPAAVVYALLIICLLFLEDCRSQPAMTDLNRIIWPLMLFLAGCIVGAALWFAWLQIGVLHAFCKYCCALHLLGCIVAAIILIAATKYRRAFPPAPLRRSAPIAASYGPGNGGNPGQPLEKTGVRPGKGRFFGPTILWFAGGLLAAAVFAVVQTKTLPDALYDSGRTEASLPTFSDGEVPVLGDCRSEPAMTDDRHARPDRASLTLLFDFQCIHCRRLHRILPELLERAGGQFSILLCPVPLSSACNPYIPASGIDRFAGSCPLTRLALAVWYSRPDAYAEYWDYLLGDGDEHAAVSPAEAEDRARALLGDSLEAALQDPRIDAYLRKAEELFGRTSSSEKSGVPRFIHGQHWLVPETDDPEALLALLRNISD